MLNLFDIKEEDIDMFENNMFDESIGEKEVYIDEDESYIYMDKKLILDNGRYALFVGSDCYYTDGGMPEPDCNVISIFINSDNIDMKDDCIYSELQSSIESCLHNFNNIVKSYERRIDKEFIKRDIATAKSLTHRHTYALYA